MFRIVEDDYPPLPPNISQDMKDFLLCCFQKDPEQRSSSKELQSHTWIQKNQKATTKRESTATTGKK
jgi:serine/threonine protein kinase